MCAGKQKWEQDPTWRPWHFEVYNAHHRIFSDEEERAISGPISKNDLLHERLFTDATFVRIATTTWLKNSATWSLLSNFNVPPASLPISNNRIISHPAVRT
jgi:hypothetical protein